MEALRLDDFSYEPYELDEAALRASDDEEPFSRSAFELHKELGQSVVLVAGAHRCDNAGTPRALTLDEAVLAGLMVRCMKLQHGILSSSTPQRMELVNFFVRGLVESAVNLRYLIQEDTPELFERFRRYSLRTDAALRRRIETNIGARGDDQPLPIETRMLNGIARAFELSGVSPADVGADDRRDWSGSIYQRFDAVGLKDTYLAFFSVQSHYTHGNWHDLFAYHLTHDADGWQPAVHFSPIRPQPLLASLTVLADAAVRYLLDVAVPSPDRDVLHERIVIASDKGERIDALHEDWLSRRQSKRPA